ncbi:MAG TPA: hypothetical protein VG889_17625 [Rhizomicrobium sp.]|nr:hypothetical protein [Rhizomicrobium sp.]
MAQSSRERLNHLLELAAQGEAGRAGLLDDLADLLTDWPADYAQAMRGPFEALFEKTAREAGRGTRARLAARLAFHDELPVALINGFFLDADAATRAHILKRNAALDDDDGEPQPAAADAASLVAAARRTMNGAFAEIFAGHLSLPRETARAILGDATGEALAVACKGAGIDRAACSALALLAGGTVPADYDAVPPDAARRLVRYWRERSA